MLYLSLSGITSTLHRLSQQHRQLNALYQQALRVLQSISLCAISALQYLYHSTAPLSSQVLNPTTIMANHSANLADPVLLGKIDKFFNLGIGEYVALPQVPSHSAVDHL